MSTKALEDLESRVMDAARLLSSLQSTNSDLKEEIEQLKNSLEKAKGENNYKSKLIKQLNDDRLEIQSRAKKVMEKVVALEKTSQS
ncbi:MAG: hypothetical protein VYA53_01675 [Acidobacteriota bacterium]|nr:hypothetical protein [Acidobacteriota bacterium]